MLQHKNQMNIPRFAKKYDLAFPLLSIFGKPCNFNPSHGQLSVEVVGDNTQITLTTHHEFDIQLLHK